MVDSGETLSIIMCPWCLDTDVSVPPVSGSSHDFSQPVSHYRKKKTTEKTISSSVRMCAVVLKAQGYMFHTVSVRAALQPTLCNQ